MPIPMMNGSICPKAATYTNCPAGVALALMWKQATCVCVKKAGLWLRSFRLHIPAYTLLLTKQHRMLPPFLYFVILLPAGWMINFMYLLFVLSRMCGRNLQDMMIVQIADGAKHLLENYPHNRLVQHLMNNCCNTYHCPAAKNFRLGRWECPVPSSPACNANCIGCISFQPVEETIVSTQDRLTFKPTAEEIVEFTVPHLETAPYPIISFGQGCEGEPLLMWETIRDSIIEIRKHTKKGSININTNGSKPDAVKALCEAGLTA